jgi:hypothetical protein
MNNFFKISTRQQTNAIETIAKKLNITPPSVEKDVWVTAVLTHIAGYVSDDC